MQQQIDNTQQQKTAQDELNYLKEEIKDIPKEKKDFVQKVVLKAIKDFKPALDKLSYE